MKLIKVLLFLILAILCLPLALAVLAVMLMWFIIRLPFKGFRGLVALLMLPITILRFPVRMMRGKPAAA